MKSEVTMLSSETKMTPPSVQLLRGQSERELVLRQSHRGSTYSVSSTASESTSKDQSLVPFIGSVFVMLVFFVVLAIISNRLAQRKKKMLQREKEEEERRKREMVLDVFKSAGTMMVSRPDGLAI